MRMIAILFLLCAVPTAASAQTAVQCPPVPRAGDLLDCYNGITPRPGHRKQVTPKVPAASAKPAKAATDQQPQVDDMLEAENKKLDAKLKTICRNC